MAAQTFLNSSDLETAHQLLTPPLRTPDGNETRVSDFKSLEFSNWLAQRLLARLQAHPDWERSGPIALGSWARGELSPKSDIDMLFCGDQDAVLSVTSQAALEGMRLRYRIPADLNDWRVGVEPFDILALFGARPLTKQALDLWRMQLAILEAEGGDFRRRLVKAMRIERASRELRYDSITSFLEPNLKYGSGGLRDLEQALVTRSLFQRRFSQENSAHSVQVFNYYKAFFLLIRQKLHLSVGSGDLLTAAEQRPLASWLGFDDVRDFMRELAKGLARVNFYADWTIAQATLPAAQIARVEKIKLDSADKIFNRLRADPSVLMQNRVRLAIDTVFSGAANKLKHKRTGHEIERMIGPQSNDEVLKAFFRSRLVDKCIPDFRKVVGLVQHDQYHRYSVDAHILQALRELKRLQQKPSRAGLLAKIVRELDPADWKLLAWVCLYHDLAKGRGGDHSVKGRALAERDLKSFGVSQSARELVSWMVLNHLTLSQAAFRENPHAAQTWHKLHEREVSGKRLLLLAVFTVVDIRATNPEAWTPWKERLLFDLISNLQKPEGQASVRLATEFSRVKLDPHFLDVLDPYLVATLPPKAIAADLQAALDARSDLAPKVFQCPKPGNQLWVRYHRRHDSTGLFLHFVRLLSRQGLSIQHAAIHTESDLGVYDWFAVKTSRTLAQVSQQIHRQEVSSESAPDLAPALPPQIEFDAIEAVSEDRSECVLSFRGKDQSGALWAAAHALNHFGVSVRWAKVHTWGRQIDDVFGIALPQNHSSVSTQSLLEKLRQYMGAQRK